MNYSRILFLIISIALTQISLAQTVEVAQAELLGDYFGLARGITATIIMTSAPTQIEKLSGQPGHSTQTERRTYTSNGLIVKVLSTSGSKAFIPVSVELTNPETIMAFSKNLSELTKSEVTPNLGKAESQTQSSFKYLGPAEICSEYLELFYRSEKLSSAKWSFCGD